MVPPPPGEPPFEGPQGVCPKCGRALENPPWCPVCSAKRQWILVALLIFVAPILGFGACFAGLSYTGDGVYFGTALGPYISLAGVAVMLLSPIAGIVLFIITLVKWRKRGR